MASGQGKSGSSGPNTKQVHPVTLTSFAPTGCELSTWAYITLPRPANASANMSANFKSISEVDADTSKNDHLTLLPNLVTAHANSLKIYVVDPITGTLILASSYDNLAGTITTLNVLPNAAGTSSKRSNAKQSHTYDGLLIGFAGQPRLSIVYPPGGLDAATAGSQANAPGCGWSGVLTASSIIDLTSVLMDHSLGSVAPLEQDLTCSVTEDGKVPTVAVVLGGGVSIATFQLPRSSYSASPMDGPTTGANADSPSSIWAVLFREVPSYV